jgi:hypothetical protein
MNGPRKTDKDLRQSVRKNAARKESSQERSHIQEQGLMTDSSCQAHQERWHSPDSGLHMAFIEERA